MRRTVAAGGAALAAAALFAVGASAGCKKQEEARYTNPTPQEQRQTIERNPNLTPEEKARYLQQVKEREMADRMNPNQGGSAIPPGVKTGPTK
jgi:hypothetical protein